ncbi:Riboflavin kinase [Wickerhamomyces ciferrii]|uniref:Riboflavin kinase n=1 Tax=Wickerhamomyces ciferrii (strain ATCC 14091 / BCRC 22168 / CBS 111 / JCM 3599 / NBRC 0793 / NRRL Y-1031 F-60-10) TaxID=1206466 RepID=K0KBP7_WICCF|nr:Riboflavin kinase [Wickerhamomyces ciferrii]CCH42480.1 Riboflavin kinase [Wickerhamomyces ciferrii]
MSENHNSYHNHGKVMKSYILIIYTYMFKTFFSIPTFIRSHNRLYTTTPMVRPDIPIPQTPQPPYPITEHDVKIVAGFGRGSSELGIPTANILTTELLNVQKLDPGVYFGYVRVKKDESHTTNEIKQRENGSDVDYKYGNDLIEGKDLNVILPHVMSIGWNPFYGNKEKAVELHIIHEFNSTFYGAKVDFNVLGYIRPELNYTTKGECFDLYLYII